jgi:hypothetical protein
MNTFLLFVFALLVLIGLGLWNWYRLSRPRDLAAAGLVPNPRLQAFELAPGVVYAAESAEHACRIANDESFDEFDPAHARQLRDDELNVAVQVIGEPTAEPTTTTLRAELVWRRSVGWPGVLSLPAEPVAEMFHAEHRA